ncbi:MAG: ABC transporter substrate-binding protein [Firmicutes bacterium]|nr:ABC transporter substrate-binding protein [Bacillota bacterium]
MRRYLVLILVLLLAPALFFLPGCGNGGSGSGLTQVRCCEVMRSVFYAPQYVALSQGFFLEQGLDIEMTTGPGADKVMAALLSDTADISLAGPESTVYVYNQGQEDYVISFAQLTQREGTFLVGRKPEADFKWENLRGRTLLGGRPGGGPEMTLEYVLQNHGLIPNQDVTVITDIQLTAVPGAFEGGTGDYAAIFEPMASMLERERVGHVIASVGVAGGDMPYAAYMARRSYIEKNPAVIQRFTNAIYKGQLWVNRHSPEEIASAVQPFFIDADLDILAKCIERYKAQNTWDSNPVLEPEGLDHLQRMIQSVGEHEKPVDSKTLITRKFADRALVEVK